MFFTVTTDILNVKLIFLQYCHTRVIYFSKAFHVYFCLTHSLTAILTFYFHLKLPLAEIWTFYPVFNLSMTAIWNFLQGTQKWYEMQDLHVIDILPQMIPLSESYIQVSG